jgi:hypothetical protein
MKKFLEFIWEMISPVVKFITAMALGGIALIWLFTGFGLLLLLAPTDFPSPLWVKWCVGIFDTFCVVVIVYDRIKEVYEKVYKNKK